MVTGKIQLSVLFCRFSDRRKEDKRFWTAT